MLIYKATNRINGKIYIGQTTRSLQKRIKGHNNESKRTNYAFHKAIRKHGIENFDFEVLFECQTLEELNKKEIELIKELKANNRDIGYNITIGGSSFGSGENHPSFGKPLSDEHKAKISKKKSGDNNPSYDFTVYSFQHPDFGTRIGTKFELRKEFKLIKGNLAAICNGKRIEHKGWRLLDKLK